MNLKNSSYDLYLWNVVDGYDWFCSKLVCRVIQWCWVQWWSQIFHQTSALGKTSMMTESHHVKLEVRQSTTRQHSNAHFQHFSSGTNVSLDLTLQLKTSASLWLPMIKFKQRTKVVLWQTSLTQSLHAKWNVATFFLACRYFLPWHMNVNIVALPSKDYSISRDIWKTSQSLSWRLRFWHASGKEASYLWQRKCW